MDWFLYDWDLRHESVKLLLFTMDVWVGSKYASELVHVIFTFVTKNFLIEILKFGCIIVVQGFWDFYHQMKLWLNTFISCLYCLIFVAVHYIVISFSKMDHKWIVIKIRAHAAIYDFLFFFITHEVLNQNVRPLLDC